MSTSEVAEKLGCAKSTVLRWLNRHDIPVRDKNNEQYPWHDEDRLRKMYKEQGLNQYEIADELGCDQVTVAKWFDKHDIETGFEHVEQLRDGDWLREKYIEEGLSQLQIAELLDCNQMSVSRWCMKHGIETRKANFEKYGHFTFNEGYARFSSSIHGDQDTVKIHRLVMVAEEGFEAVCDMDVHHKNGIRWDNRAENLELMNPSDHISMHRQKRDI